MNRIFKAITEEISAMQRNYKFSIMGYVYELITYLARNYSQLNQYSNRFVNNDITAKITADVILYIQ